MAALALLVLSAAGCGARPVTQRSVLRQAPAATNQQRAEQEARRLAGMVRLPGATPTSLRPPALAYPLLGVPAVRSLAQVTRYVTVAQPTSGVLAWLRAHPPGGLARTGVSAQGYGYTGPASPAWQSAELEVSVAPGGAGSVVRIGGVVAWLDPTPRPDSVSGPRLRVDAATGCPASDRGAVGVRNPDAPTTRLLPPGTPDGGLICRYNGGNGAAFALLAATRLDAQQAARLATAVAALPLAHPDGEARSCPFDDGASAVLALSYRQGPDVDLWVRMNGCRVVANGAITAAAGAVPDQLRAAAPAATSPSAHPNG